MQNWPKPLLQRRQTNPELRPLSASEQESVEQARPLISQIQSLSETDLDRRAVVVTGDVVLVRLECGLGVVEANPWR